MKKSMNLNDIFVCVTTGNKVWIYEASSTFGEETIVRYKYQNSIGEGEMTVDNFNKCFKPKGYVRNVNQDILKLIEAGYEFSSFWGDTVDGRSINIDLNEEEVK